MDFIAEARHKGMEGTVQYFVCPSCKLIQATSYSMNGDRLFTDYYEEIVILKELIEKKYGT